MNGKFSTSCEPLATMSAEVCDGLDNDCDGQTDECQTPGDKCLSTGQCGQCVSDGECSNQATACVDAVCRSNQCMTQTKPDYSGCTPSGSASAGYCMTNTCTALTPVTIEEKSFYLAYTATRSVRLTAACCITAVLGLACVTQQRHLAGTSGAGAGGTDSANTGGAAANAQSHAGRTGSSNLSFPACPVVPAEPRTADAAAEPPDRQLGFTTSAGPQDREGTIVAVADDHLEISSNASNTDAINFNWQGPPLSAAYNVGDRVRFSGPIRSGEYGMGGVSTLRSARSTAVVADESEWVVLGTTPGSQTSKQLAEVSLNYTLTSCCSFNSRNASCSYNALVASVGVDSAAIERGSTASVGAWQVTHLGSALSIAAEWSWSVTATVLGPTSAFDADAGS